MKKQRTLLKELKRRSGMRRRLLAKEVREREGGGRENEGEVEGWGEREGLLACVKWSRSNVYTGSLYRQPILQIWRGEAGREKRVLGEQGRENGNPYSRFGEGRWVGRREGNIDVG